MPPKKTQLEALRAKIKKDKAKKHKPVEIQPIKRKKTFQPTKSNIAKLGKEEKSLSKFFTKLAIISDEDVLKNMQIFATMKDAAWDRSRFFDEITTSMDISDIKEFARNAAIQDQLRSYDFFKSYIQQPEVNAKIQAYLQGKQEREDEIERLQKIERDLFGSNTEEREITESIPVQHLRTKPIEIDESGDPQKGSSRLSILNKRSEVKSPKYKFSPWKNTACVKLYKDVPWIDKKIEAIYISTDTEVPDSWEDSYISPYVHDEDTMEYDGQAWYLVNNKYYDLQCNVHSHNRSQKGDILTVYNNSNESLKIRIAYKTDVDIIIQDAALFQKELVYLKQRGKNRDEKIRDILKEPVTEQAKQIGINIMAAALNKIAPNIVDYHVDGEYVQKAVDAIQATTIGEFAKQLGDLIVYLDLDLRTRVQSGTKVIIRDIFDWDLLKTVQTPHFVKQYKNENKSANIFINRIKGEYYLPDILINLSPGEKLPEVFNDPNSTEQKRVLEYTEKLVEMFMFMFGNELYLFRFPGEKYKVVYSKSHLKLKMDPWKAVCVNAKDVEDLPDMDVVYYNDGENIYCLIIKELIERFREGDHTNPITNDHLSEAFILRFNQLYNPKIIIEEQLPDEPKEEQQLPKSSNILAPGLMKKVKISIDLLQAQQEVSSDFQSNAPYSDSESIASDTGSFTPEEIVDTGVDENCTRCTQCTHCGKKLGKTRLDSMKYKNQKPTQVSFCDFNCFENHEDWPKIRRK